MTGRIRGGGDPLGCEWEVKSMVETDDGRREADRHACGAPVTHLAVRADFKRPLRTCNEHVGRARKYGFKFDRGHA